MKIWIYRPDKANRNINWSGVYNATGQSWIEYERDEGEAYEYKEVEREPIECDMYIKTPLDLAKCLVEFRQKY